MRNGSIQQIDPSIVLRIAHLQHNELSTFNGLNILCYGPSTSPTAASPISAIASLLSCRSSTYSTTSSRHRQLHSHSKRLLDQSGDDVRLIFVAHHGDHSSTDTSTSGVLAKGASITMTVRITGNTTNSRSFFVSLLGMVLIRRLVWPLAMVLTLVLDVPAKLWRTSS